jgi:3-oxocholest-4-en-26-oyl-CoA dehydrogenase alpha subunit
MLPVLRTENSEWREELRDFLDAELPQRYERDSEFVEDNEYWTFAKKFTRKVGEKGWISLTWPRPYGSERPVLDRLVMAEEFAYRDAPLVNHHGWGLAAGALLSFGTDAQRQRYMPSIIRLDEMWLEGFSEPGAGSDLAALSTRADPVQGGWRVNGQKTYTTWGGHGDVMFLAARTDQDAPKHAGISIFRADMKAPGVTVSPLFNLGGGRQNLTYFEDVFVDEDCLIGELNQGWKVIMTALYASPGTAAPYAPYARRLERLVEYCHSAVSAEGAPLIYHPMVRVNIAEMATIVGKLRLLSYNAALRRDQEIKPPFGGSLEAVVLKEELPRFTELYNQILGPIQVLSQGSSIAPLDGAPEEWYRQSFRAHAGGTSQVKRMVLATRGLGLPR